MKMIEIYFEASCTDNLCKSVSSIFHLLSQFYIGASRKKVYVSDASVKFDTVLKDDGSVDFVYALVVLKCVKKKEAKIVKQISPIFHASYEILPNRFNYRINITDEESAAAAVAS